MIKMQQNIHYLNSYIRKNSIGMANGQRKESNLKMRVTILPKIDSSIILYFLGDQYRHLFGKGLVCPVERAH